MKWEEAFRIVAAAIASAGGIGAIIVACVKFSSDMIAKRLEARYQNRLDKELEKYKSQLGNKTYISKVRFDKEFEVYASLSEKFHAAILYCQALYPVLDIYPRDADRLSIFGQKYKDACFYYNDAMNTLYSNALFIPKETYEGFEKIRKLCNDVLVTFETYGCSGMDYEPLAVEGRRKAVDTGIEARNEMNRLSDSIREYLASIDVLN